MGLINSVLMVRRPVCETLGVPIIPICPCWVPSSQCRRPGLGKLSLNGRLTAETGLAGPRVAHALRAGRRSGSPLPLWRRDVPYCGAAAWVRSGLFHATSVRRGRYLTRGLMGPVQQMFPRPSDQLLGRLPPGAGEQEGDPVRRVSPLGRQPLWTVPRRADRFLTGGRDRVDPLPR